MYQSTADLPDMGDFNEYPHANSNGTTYRYYIGAPPTFRFGDGLSYTQFKYSSLQLPAMAAGCANITLSVIVTNVGQVTSDEVVQVYVSVPAILCLCSSVPVCLCTCVYTSLWILTFFATTRGVRVRWSSHQLGPAEARVVLCLSSVSQSASLCLCLRL